MQRYSYDRLEGAVAVLVDDTGESVSVPITELSADAQAGDRLVKTETGYAVDKQNTADIRRRVLDLQRRLRRQ